MIMGDLALRAASRTEFAVDELWSFGEKNNEQGKRDKVNVRASDLHI